MKTFLVDTNIIIRFITGEPEKQAELAAEFLQTEDQMLQFSPIVVAEVVFVLTGKIYAYPRQAVVDELLQFLKNPSFKVLELEILEKALDLFSQHNIDFADAYLAASAILSGHSVASFGRDFKPIKDLEARIL